MSVFVLDKNKKPLMSCSEKRAKKLLTSNKAVIHKHYPFTIRLKDRVLEKSEIQPVEIKLDPGSKYTGIALVRKDKQDIYCFGLYELKHRGHSISESLQTRSGHRKFRRSKLRYRPARFNNRTRKEGWLPPSLEHRVETTMSWVHKFKKLVPISNIVVERVKFDMQKMQNHDINGDEYQQGTLQGYNVREYLLEKWGRKCAYCDKKEVPFEIEHIVPRSKGGPNSVSNLTLSCNSCNRQKGSNNIEDFVKDEKRLNYILQFSKKPLKDASAVNATRNKLLGKLIETGLPVETGTGAMTKFNRIRLNVDKSHCLDAMCVSSSELSKVVYKNDYVTNICSKGHGSRSLIILNKYGFPRSYRKIYKNDKGFQTGDYVKNKKNKKIHGRMSWHSIGNSIRITLYSTMHFEKISSGIGQYDLIQRGNGYSINMIKNN
jgi:5-methylcytosine-specific restriction endonuclease McrA